ncbi:hypothetical protein M9991_16760 [Chryseobacterium gallinarum]|uniref:hypothetical protein n=1 Tax=Chryseobacterium gallinarum TaxID=1324352 RepID=UPI002024BC6F|nr:hypothetical protein [Chryseobacterium gallinarum]MCL8538520.1 hypothetical protein [Chryseobacterium gallinarum]
MKKVLSIVLLTSLIFGSCAKNPEKETGKIRFIFDPGNLKFISSSFNPNLQTMSALYGNQKGISALGTKQGIIGVDLKLVTYKMQDDPNYFGSKVNGELLSVETVKTDQMGNLKYGIEFGRVSSNESSKQRMSSILEYQPIKLPQ